MLQQISKVALSLLFLFQCGCALFAQPDSALKDTGPKQKVYFAKYEDVWRAAQLAMARYYMSVNNIDTGVLETDFIKGLDGWQAPDSAKPLSTGQRYKLTLRIAKGRVGKKESVRVTATKRTEIQKDFFSESEPLQSDGLEEEVILYRIERELIIDKALKKAAKKS